MLTVYLDLVVILNFLVDFLLILGTNRLSGFPMEPVRCTAAAAFGGIYSGACMLQSFRFLGSLLWRLVSLALMAGAAFGWNRGTWKRSGIFILLSMSLGGVAVCMGEGDVVTLVLAAGCVWILCRLAFGQTVGGREYVPITLSWEDRSVSLIALRDSGNLLRDPITGEHVFLISSEAASRLTGLTGEELRNPLETIARQSIPGLRLIPFSSVGKGTGMLLARRFERIHIGNAVRSGIVAFTPEAFGRGEVYQALAPID